MVRWVHDGRQARGAVENRETGNGLNSGLACDRREVSGACMAWAMCVNTTGLPLIVAVR